MSVPIHCAYKTIFADGARTYRLMPASFRLRFWNILFLQVFFALTEVATVLVLAFFAMSMGNADAVKQTPAVRFVFSSLPFLASACSDNRYFLVCSSLFVFVFIGIRNAGMAWVMLKTSYFAERLSVHIGQETISRYLNMEYAWHLSKDRNTVYECMLARATLATFLTAQLLFYSNIMTSVMLFVSLFAMEPTLTMLVLAVYALVSWATYSFSRARIDTAGNMVIKHAKDENLAMGAVTRGIREVLTYRLQRVFVDAIARCMQEVVASRAFLGIAGAIPTWLLETTGFATITLALITRIHFFDDDLPSIVWACSMLFLTAWRVLPSVGRAMRYLVTMQESSSAAIPMLNLLETFIAKRIEPAPAPDEAFRYNEALDLADLSFRYADADADSLHGVSMTIRRGECVGIIGSSGAGKSTLAGVLCGLLSPTGGAMLVDGKELTSARLAAYRERLGYVPQSPYLFNGTVLENVALSQWGQPIDRNRALQACKAAAMDFVTNNGKELDLNVSEVNAALSGGQIQRLSIARAIFTDPAIIIFDEATSSLDKANEDAILTTIRRFHGQVSCVIITHRRSTLECCDRIYWLEKGRIRDFGTLEEVLPKYEEYIRSLGKDSSE